MNLNPSRPDVEAAIDECGDKRIQDAIDLVNKKHNHRTIRPEFTQLEADVLNTFMLQHAAVMMMSLENEPTSRKKLTSLLEMLAFSQAGKKISKALKEMAEEDYRNGTL